MSISNKDNSLRNARNLGQLNNTKTFTDFVGKDDRIDFRKFRLTQRSSLSLLVNQLKSPVNVKLLNQQGGTVANFRSKKKGQIALDLDPGTYYVQVKHLQGNTRYRLKLTASGNGGSGGSGGSSSPPDDNTPLNSRKLGTLGSGTLSYSDYVGDLDAIDYYEFNLNAVSDFNANLLGLTGGAGLYLYRDSNGNQQIDSDERVDYDYAGNTGNIFQILTPGSYLIGVEKSSSTQYNLTLTTTLYPNYTPAADPGNITTNASSLSPAPFSGTYTTKDYVGNLDSTDYYQFSLNAVSDFNANLLGLTGGTSMYLYRDNNGNGQIDTGERVDYEYVSAGVSENISQILTPGNYFFAVEEYGSTRYDLILTATPYSDYTPAVDPGDRTATALDLSTFSGSRSFKDYIGDLDSSDYYKFNLSQTRSFNANLTGITEGLYMYLYRDNNSNGQIDTGEQIEYEYVSAGSGENISETLTAGNYFFEVRRYGSTRYDLIFQAT